MSVIVRSFCATGQTGDRVSQWSDRASAAKRDDMYCTLTDGPGPASFRRLTTRPPRAPSTGPTSNTPWHSGRAPSGGSAQAHQPAHTPPCHPPHWHWASRRQSHPDTQTRPFSVTSPLPSLHLPTPTISIEPAWRQHRDTSNRQFPPRSSCARAPPPRLTDLWSPSARGHPYPHTTALLFPPARCARVPSAKRRSLLGGRVEQDGSRPGDSGVARPFGKRKKKERKQKKKKQRFCRPSLAVPCDCGGSSAAGVLRLGT